MLNLQHINSANSNTTTEVTLIPGLADEELRIAAGKAISDGLRKGGTFKVLFFVTQETG